MFILGISGAPGSGKENFIQNLLLEETVQKNSKILSLKEYTTSSNLNYLESPLSVDWKILKQDLIKYKHTRPNQILIVKGLYTSFHEEIRSLFDLQCYIDNDSDTILVNLLKDKNIGNLSEFLKDYIKIIKPSVHNYILSQKNHVDIIVGENVNLSIKIIQSALKDFIQNFITEKDQNETILN